MSDLDTDIDGRDMTIFTAYTTHIDYINDTIVYNQIDLENLDKIEICGVSYSLEEINSPIKE